MEPLKERLVSEGNAFYEIDLECLKKKGEKKKEKREEKRETKKREGAEKLPPPIMSSG